MVSSGVGVAVGVGDSDGVAVGDAVEPGLAGGLVDAAGTIALLLVGAHAASVMATATAVATVVQYRRRVLTG
ncbi:MAG: hypothetical protein JWQ43_1137 [Glaciihabitans sp.]|nr:hypothetical protein [Glaciihabitans sp.]